MIMIRNLGRYLNTERVEKLFFCFCPFLIAIGVMHGTGQVALEIQTAKITLFRVLPVWGVVCCDVNMGRAD